MASRFTDGNLEEKPAGFCFWAAFLSPLQWDGQPYGTTVKHICTIYNPRLNLRIAAPLFRIQKNANGRFLTVVAPPISRHILTDTAREFLSGFAIFVVKVRIAPKYYTYNYRIKNGFRRS